MEWINWNGGHCPVPLDTCVKVKLIHKSGTKRDRDGYDSAEHFNGLGWWRGIDTNWRIYAYRIVECEL